MDDTVRLWAEWHGEKAISDQRDAELIENDEITIAGGEDGFAELLRNPNMYQKYKTQNQVLEEIIDNGLCNIANEVGTQKIGNPYREQDVYAVESWYSFNSLDDYENNIISIENSYLGGPAATRKSETSMSAYVASKNSDLDAEITKAISDARKAIRDIPAPFRDQVTKGKVATIDTAMDKLAELNKSLEKIKSVL